MRFNRNIGSCHWATWLVSSLTSALLIGSCDPDPNAPLLAVAAGIFMPIDSKKLFSIRPSFWPDGASIIDKKISLIELIILVLTVHWLLSFFGQSIVPGIPLTGGFIDWLLLLLS